MCPAHFILLAGLIIAHNTSVYPDWRSLGQSGGGDWSGDGGGARLGARLPLGDGNIGLRLNITIKINFLHRKS